MSWVLVGSGSVGGTILGGFGNIRRWDLTGKKYVTIMILRCIVSLTLPVSLFPVCHEGSSLPSTVTLSYDVLLKSWGQETVDWMFGCQEVIFSLLRRLCQVFGHSSINVPITQRGFTLVWCHRRRSFLTSGISAETLISDFTLLYFPQRGICFIFMTGRHDICHCQSF